MGDLSPVRLAAIVAGGCAAIALCGLLVTGVIGESARIPFIVLEGLLVAVVTVLLPAHIRARSAPFLGAFVAAVSVIAIFVPQDDSSSGDAGAAPTGPSGSLTYDSIGAVSQGMTPAQVKERFGSPSQLEKTGQLGGLEPKLIWTWNLPSGRVSVFFGQDDRRMTSYMTDSPRLPTVWGTRVGDSYASLDEIWGSSLQPLNLGTDLSDEQNGLWFVEYHGDVLMFRLADGAVASIQGGESLVAE